MNGDNDVISGACRVLLLSQSGWIPTPFRMARPRIGTASICLLLGMAIISTVQAFLAPLGTVLPAVRRSPGVLQSSVETGADKTSGIQETIQDRLMREWELDCYSRPVTGDDGKKLWELLICDSLGQQRVVERLPSNMVNSRELRKLVEKVRGCPGALNLHWLGLRRCIYVPSCSRPCLYVQWVGLALIRFCVPCSRPLMRQK